MATRGGGPGPGFRHRALRGLLLLCLWLPGSRPGEPAAPSSGVDRLLQDFRRQLQRARPREELEPELLGGPREDCPGAGGTAVYRAVPDTIIRTQDSIAAGASFLRAPGSVRGWRQCVTACCSEPSCSVAVVQLPRGPSVPAPMPAPRCYLFNCTARGRSVCKFAPLRGYRTYTLSRAEDAAGIPPRPDEDKPPVSKAGKDVVLHLPTDGVVLDGRESSDDHAIVLYEWTLQQGDPSSVDMKLFVWQVPQPGTLRLSRLKEGAYIFQLTVTDSVGQRSSDNVSVTVLPRPYSTGVALDRKLVTHTVATSAQPGAMGLNEGEGDPKLEKSQRATTHNQPATVSHPETRIHSTQKAPESQINPVQPDSNSSGKNQEEGNYDLKSKSGQAGGEHPAPEAGAVLPLALGLAITVLLLLMVTCRLRLVKQKLKKARPITSEESDYLINGMYL
ncbi:low-density lipoprotein receptor-related protein 11 isoform 6 precursor [Mus musculus]|uniref:low-density lipoprotein receptor-related protein 11 isoform 6 precursor n=1 Tax=Mus musculus TaxID=10090 RepID=UPI0003D787DB|nr:low-density lipoprotein receptor-related protein 11 isoform 6 precursor [Mus musculus]|eukprot:XP_006512783.1 PREDICTED: low-density lipoprotein receptor-related protein 11 isoform X2 [Mus musculus]